MDGWALGPDRRPCREPHRHRVRGSAPYRLRPHRPGHLLHGEHRHPAAVRHLVEVPNYGPDAENAHGLHGRIRPGRGPRIHERTRYRGRHYVEVWIVKDGRVVVSDHHDVVIR
ncbi:hypothetical protein [Streptomyces sp. NPDC090026]|uniref:nucleotide-binding domain-containing protein n=1 Tax=Streptomyces sp. NPDC090026 TaxID=3365923 RepID=UPI003803A9A5